MGAATSTTPAGKDVPKKDIVGIMAAHGIPYAATLSLAHQEDAMRKLRYAIDQTGFRFLHILSPCPTGWKSEPADGIELVRLATRTGLYAVYEVFNGSRVEINVQPESEEGELARYFELQGRFKKAQVNLGQVSEGIARQWRELRARARRAP
jgi:pyruvate ferredoxin oxidoreductase beta subunit/2-oxoisovalerate ferredoxin oxidoreductase beta subunit